MANVIEFVGNIRGPVGPTGPTGPVNPDSAPTDIAVGQWLSTTGGSVTRTALGLVVGIYAPPPTGNATADTANLQTLLLQAQSTRGTLFLQEGTYMVTSLATNPGPFQPRIVGRGKNFTFLKGTTTGATLTFKGNQTGSFSGGYLSDIGFQGIVGSVGWEIRGCVDVHWDRLGFGSYMAVGILFHNYAAGDFTEYCSGNADFGPGCLTAVEYRKTNGDPSFNGSGLTDTSTINQPQNAVNPTILIGAGCLPYNAPLSFMIWAGTVAQPIIRNNGNAGVNFYGNLRLETNTITIVDTASPNPIIYVGGYNAAAVGTVTPGKLVFATRATWNAVASTLTVEGGDTGWLPFTPTLTNLTQGAGTIIARYRQSGKTVEFTIRLVLQSGSVVGTNPVFSLPVNAAQAIPVSLTGLLRLGGVVQQAGAVLSGNTVGLYAVSTSGAYATHAPISATVPGTWTSGDYLMVGGVYEGV